jgi:hypothetical protein
MNARNIRGRLLEQFEKANLTKAYCENMGPEFNYLWNENVYLKTPMLAIIKMLNVHNLFTEKFKKQVRSSKAMHPFGVCIYRNEKDTFLQSSYLLEYWKYSEETILSSEVQFTDANIPYSYYGKETTNMIYSATLTEADRDGIMAYLSKLQKRKTNFTI